MTFEVWWQQGWDGLFRVGGIGPGDSHFGREHAIRVTSFFESPGECGECSGYDGLVEHGGFGLDADGLIEIKHLVIESESEMLDVAGWDADGLSIS